MAEFTFAEMMRTGHVKRWQIVRTAREQTLAEHMYRVWVATQFICKALEVPKPIADSAGIWALIHDIPEVITGDIATPAKQAMRAAVPDQDPIKNIELSLSVAYKYAWETSKEKWGGWPTANELVKLADIIEARCFLGCEKLGDHADMVYQDLNAQVNRMMDGFLIKYPLRDWSKLTPFLTETRSKV